MEKMKLKSNELSFSNRCNKRRKLKSLLGNYEGFEYKKAVIIKSVLKEALKEDWDRNQIEKVILDSFDSLNFQGSRQKEIQAEDAANCIFRYISCETREPLPGVKPMDIDIFENFTINVAPDFVFFTKNGIEVVKIKTGKPNITQNGLKRDASANKNLELFSLFCYGREIVPDGKEFNVTASYYFLRKDNDSSIKENFDSDFFDKRGKNVVSISGFVSKKNGKDGACTLDETFRSQYDDFFAGEECAEDDCKTCSLYNICYYKESPQYEEREKDSKSLKELELTPQQKAAISFNKGYARINAGAGTGKTLTIALHVVSLLLNGVKPEEILMLTFTNNGADEMKERVQLYNLDFGTGVDISKMSVSTFNSFANDIIVKEYSQLGFSAPPELIDNIERAGIISDILKDKIIEGLDYRNFAINMKYCKGALAIVEKAFQIIKSQKLSLEDEEKLKEFMGPDFRFMTEKSLLPLLSLYEKYDNELKRRNLIEYADQELLLFELLKKNPDYLHKMGIKHIVVDEFQDSNLQQMNLIQELCAVPSFESLIVVGDDSQAIFGFRDTSPEYIINFFDLMDINEQERTDFYLLDNHRSTPEIIELANKINALNQNRVEKDLIPTRKSLKKNPVVQGFDTSEEEDAFIAEKIKEKIQNGAKPEDIAYIAADRYALLNMGMRLTEAGIPWAMMNPEPVLENSKVISALGLAKALEEPEYVEGMLVYLNALYENELLNKTEEEITCLLHGIQTQLEKIRNLPDGIKRVQFHELIEAVNTDDDELYTNFIEVLDRQPNFKTEMKYLNNFELYGQKETFKRTRNYPGVILTTAHSAKGLEWKNVFVSISKFDYKELRNNEKDIEEKRRLLFVAITRARDELTITSKYIAFGGTQKPSYNMFLEELYSITGQTFNPDDLSELKNAS